MILSKSARMFAPVLLAVLCFVIGDAASVPGKGPSEETKRASAGPEYDAKGNLKIPTDFKTWIFVGSSLGLDYRSDVAEKTVREKAPNQERRVGDFHNVYINPAAYEEYFKTGKFPDKTVLVMDVYQAKDKEPQNIVQGGHYSAAIDRSKWRSRTTTAPMDQTDWAYYAFSCRQDNTSKAFKDGLITTATINTRRRQCLGAVLSDLRDLKKPAGK